MYMRYNHGKISTKGRPLSSALYVPYVTLTTWPAGAGLGLEGGRVVGPAMFPEEGGQGVVADGVSVWLSELEGREGTESRSRK